MNQHTLKQRGFLAVLVASVAALAAGCGGGAGAFCNEARNCEGGNDSDESACNIGADEEAQLADLHNCSPEYDELANCIYDNARCNNKSYGPDDKTCADLTDRFHKCMQ